MTTLESHAGTAPAGWDETICRLGGSIFHTTLWADYMHASRGTEPLFVLGREADGDASAAALALVWQSSHRLAARIFRDLELYAHPCGSTTATAALLDQTESLARRLGCRELRLSSMMSGESPYLPIEHGYHETQRIEFVVDLTQPTETIWRAVRKDQRERIRRLARDGVHIAVAASRADLDALRAVRESTQDKRQQRGQEYELPDEDQFYDDLHAYLVARGAARLFVARRDAQPLAALFCVTFNGRACSVFSGSTADGYRLGAQGGLFWTAVESFKAHGFAQLNRGGVPAAAQAESHPQHGIYQFKLRLGTTPQLCRSGEKILSPWRDRFFRLRDTLRGLRTRS